MLFGLFSKKKSSKDGLVALTSDELLKPYKDLLSIIHQQVGIPDSHWQKLYLQFIHNFAKQVQLLPASESHHHCGAGGLLTHSLEVGLNALKLRKGKMLPVGASSEVIEKEKELWSYAVFTAAMLHDIGKPLTDQIINIVSDGNRLLMPLTEVIPIKSQYKISFRRGRRYRSHENVALLLASRIIPDPGLNWITSNSAVLDDWTFCLTGRKSEAGSLGELITHADQLSTAKNLTGGVNNTQLPSAKTVPLHVRLKTALIFLLDEGEIPLNRSGAAGWVFDDKLWLVSKRVLDEIKKHMLQEGQTGIPSDNTRLMDELMQHDIITSSDTDRAVWKVTVSVDSWKNNFTCLCFPMHKLWADSTAWPKQPASIKVVSTKDNDNKESIKETKENTTKASKSIPPSSHTEQEHSGESNEIPNEKTTNSEQDQLSQAPTLPTLELPTPPGIDKVIDEKEDDDKKKTVETNNKKTESKPTSKKANVVIVDDENFTLKKRQRYGQDFVDWLSNGIADGSMPINITGAVVHTVGEEKSLLLVSPLIFRKYAKSRPDIKYEQLQRDFQALKLHKITDDNKNVWKFKTISNRKNKKPNILSGMLIEEPEKKLTIRLPPGNSHIEPFKKK